MAAPAPARIRRKKQKQGVSKEVLFVRISDEAYLHLNQRAEELGVSMAKAAEIVILRDKKPQYVVADASPIANVVSRRRVN